jgi:hypothetical protein
LDDSFDVLPLYIQCALGVSRDWTDEARCRRPGQRDARSLWLVSSGEVLDFGGSRYTGANLIQLALLTCLGCPVQWQCTRFALETWPNWGTWGVDISGLRWLKKRKAMGSALLDKAEEDGVPVQVAVGAARAAEARERKLERAMAGTPDMICLPA